MGDEREPLGLALIVCDGVHGDPATGKKTLLGLFSTVCGPQFPITLGQMCVYAAITDCLGKVSLQIRLVDVNEERPAIFDIPGNFDSSDPLAVQDITFGFQNVTFPEPGEYRVQLYAGGVPILERRLMAINPSQPPTEGDDDE